MFRRKYALAAIVLGMISSPLAAPQASAAAFPAASTDAPSTKSREAKPPAAKAPQVPNLTSEQILEKHVAARGGVQAWKAVQTLQLSGKMDAGRGDSNARAMQIVNSHKKFTGKGTSMEPGAAAGSTQNGEQQVQLPFTLNAKRPNKTRLEIVFAGKTAVQVYDGAHGWKLRPFLNRNNAEPFTAEEAKSEATRSDLDGPLIDYAAKGTKVSLEGVEQVEGQPAYKLKVTPKGGGEKHVWIDAKTFLDVKVDGVPRRMDGKMCNVYLYQRDFRKVDGLVIPFVLETAVDGYSETHTMIIEKVAVNPHLDDALFAKPQA